MIQRCHIPPCSTARGYKPCIDVTSKQGSNERGTNSCELSTRDKRIQRCHIPPCSTARGYKPCIDVRATLRGKCWKDKAGELAWGCVGGNELIQKQKLCDLHITNCLATLYGNNDGSDRYSTVPMMYTLNIGNDTTLWQ